MKIAFEYDFETHRCWTCGRRYAVEKGFQKCGPSCPFCANSSANNKEAEIQKLKRGLRSIRAYLKRIKKP